MRVWILPAVAALFACSDQAAEAERKYKMAERAGEDSSELCRRAREVAEAFLEDHKEREYQLWEIKADLKCNAARIDAL
jgi:hypothetical protein